MKKKIICIFAILLTVIILGAIATDHFVYNKVRGFSLEDYSYEIENFSTDITLDKRIETARQAKKEAEIIFKQVYGDSVNNKKPYFVFFDSNNEVWLVCGTYTNIFPGGPHILIKQSDGKVLAVWHDKF